MSFSSNRLSADALFMMIAHLVAERGTCARAKVGAVIVLDRRIISTGYVGAPPGREHCIDVGCDLVDGHCVRTIHAEANAIAFAARSGTSIAGATLYCTHAPCHTCSQLVLSSGLAAVRFTNQYDSRVPDSLDTLRPLDVAQLILRGHEHDFIGTVNQECIVCGQELMFHT